MGYYIETPKSKGKAQWLIDNAQGIQVIPDWEVTKLGHVLVCVVDNGPFEAAGICYSENELDSFARPDGRPKTWVAIPKDQATKLCPEFKELL